MQLWEGQSFIPFSKRRADERVRKGQTAGVSPGTFLWAVWGAQGARKGSVSPAVLITQCCWTQETRFISELNCTEETVALSPVGGFCTRYASVLQTCSALAAALGHTFAAGLAAEPRLLGFPHVTTSPANTSRVSVCVQGAVGSPHMAAHSSWLVMRRSSCG